MEKKDLIVFLLRRFPGLDDEELSRLSGLTPAQRDKQVCRELERRQLLERRAEPKGIIRNYVAGSES